MPTVDDKRMRALAAAMVRESERETLQGIRLELEQVRRRLMQSCKPLLDGAALAARLVVSSRLQGSMTAWVRLLRGFL